jgi:predicted nucleic acid-binding Zn finger protein
MMYRVVAYKEDCIIEEKYCECSMMILDIRNILVELQHDSL